MDPQRRGQRLVVIDRLLTLAIVAGAAGAGALAELRASSTVLVVTSAVVMSVLPAWLATNHALDRNLAAVYGARARSAEASPLRPADSIDRRRRIQQILNAANSLRVVYQPIVDLKSLEVVGYEALSRFTDGRPPDEWFAEARSVDLGVELEMLAVSRALETVPLETYVSINVGPATLASRAFRQLLTERVVTELVVELTEHVGIDDYASIREPVALLRERGGRLAVDDAGGSYVSMRHVVAIAPDIIKLDRSLISALDDSPRHRELARSLSDFAHRTGASVVAEGIERPGEYSTCIEVGIDHGQGYLLGRPASAFELAFAQERVTTSSTSMI